MLYWKRQQLVTAMATQICLLLLFSLSVAAQSQYSAHTGHWYRLVERETFQSWKASREVALSNGGYLATIQDSVENSFVLNLANGVSNAVYIGGTDETLEGVWVWENGSPFSYTHWAPGEPSNSNAGEDYLELWTSGVNSGYWNDTPGLPTNTSAYVIEYDQDPTTIIQAFFEDFEDSNGWEGRWGQDLPSLQTLVSSPVHAGSGALEFRSTIPGSCHSSRYRVAFEAATGFYSAWANQRHHEAGFGIYVQVQPGVNPDPIFRESYFFVLQAANGSAPQVMSLMRRHENGSGEMLAQMPTTFLKDEWIQIFVYRKAGGVIECGYVRDGTTFLMTATDPNPITEPGEYHLWACSDVPPYTYFDDVSYVPDSDPFCDDFEDGGGWTGRWLQDLPSLQTLVSSPTHSGSGALEFRSTIPGSCHSSLKREGFLASTGLYSVWVNQQHHEAGFGFYLQVQPGVNPDPIYRESYYFVLQASDAEAPKVMSLMRRHEDGSGEMLAQAPTTFLKGEWIQAFVRRKAGGELECGYVRNCDTIKMNATDPNPIVAPGSFHLWACADVPPYTYFDDAGYNPDPMGEGCGECVVSCCIGTTGNVNKSISETPDLSDLSLLISFLTVTPKPTLPCPAEANINRSVAATPDLSDLSLLISFLTVTPKPTLPSCGSGVQVQETQLVDMELSVSEKAEGETLNLSTSEPLLGVLVKVRTTGGVISHLDDEIDIITERSGAELTVLAIDLQGKATIGAGVTQAFSFSDPFEIVSAEGSTRDFKTVYATFGPGFSNLPDKISLSQNYPNPFNPTTEISYSLSTAAHVTLGVYNLTGQRVTTLVNTDQSAGTHTVRWDASQYASGVYMYRLTAGEFVETKKMLLIK